MALVDRLPAGGAWMRLVADGENVGLVTNVNHDIDHGLQPIKVIGVRGPVAYDQLDYNLSITIGAFMPHIRGRSDFPDKGTMSVADFLPLRSQTEMQSQAFILEVLQVLNIKTGDIVHQFNQVSLASEGSQFQPNSYIALNVRMMALEKII